MIDLENYHIDGIERLPSPSLVLFREIMDANLAETLRLCGGADRWRPHVKTHKTREIVRAQQSLGITKHKCATIAEAEMLAEEKVPDVLIAYQMVGPNIERLERLLDKFPGTKFACLVDHPAPALDLGQHMARLGKTIDVLLDLNSGMDRTGIPLNQQAYELYELIATTPGLRAAGLHWYDGQHRDPDPGQRRLAILQGWRQFLGFRDRLLLNGLDVPRVVASGSGSFSILAETGEPNLELSPGTTTLYDVDYLERFPDLNLRPALAIVTRVISHSGGSRMTLDVGHKACAADQPAGKRLFFPSLASAREVQHSEEHLVVDSPSATKYSVGDVLLAFPRHVCPTVHVHQAMHVVAAGRIVDRWAIAARDRILTI